MIPGNMENWYKVDAETRASNGVIIRDVHLETPDENEAIGMVMRCWLVDRYVSVQISSIWKEKQFISRTE